MLGRHRVVAEQYKQHTQQVKTKYQTMGDFIKHQYLPHLYDIVHDDDGNIRCVLSSEYTYSVYTCTDDERTIKHLKHITRLTHNNFPYAVQSYISHYVLWSCRPLSEYEIDLLLSHVYDIPSTHAVLKYVNPPHLQSIKDLFHVQVFTCPHDRISTVND